MGLKGIEPLTSRLSGVRSNQLSYRPINLRCPPEPTENIINNRLKYIRANNDVVRPRCLESPRRLGHTVLLRKEVIQPQLPLRLPCYDLAPVIGFTLGAAFLAVRQTTSGAPNFRGLTGGVYKARERIHRCLLISDY